MRKGIIIFGAVITGFLLTGIILVFMFHDKKGLIYILSAKPSGGSSLAADEEIEITAAYLFWEYSPKVDYYASAWIKRAKYERAAYKIEEVKLPAAVGLVTLKITLQDVMCGLDPIVRESQSRSEIVDKVFKKLAKSRMMHRYHDEVDRLTTCRYKDVKYPFELKVVADYRFKKNRAYGRFHIDRSGFLVFEVNQ